MPVAAEWGYEQAKNVMEWFNLMVRQYADFNITSILEEIINDKKRKALFIEELQRADSYGNLPLAHPLTSSLLLFQYELFLPYS